MCLREWQVQLLEREIKPLQYEQERDESVSPDSKSQTEKNLPEQLTALCLGSKNVCKMDGKKAGLMLQNPLQAFMDGVKLVALMQATLEQMDTMKGTKLYRHGLKKKINMLEKELEATVIGPLSSLDSTDENMVNRIQSNIELIIDMNIEEIGSLRLAVDEHREKKDKQDNEGRGFTNLKLNGMVIRSLPLFVICESRIITTMNLKLSQNEPQFVTK